MSELDGTGFMIDGYDHRWEAIAFGDPWNGWATPIVTRETLDSIADLTGALRLTRHGDRIEAQGLDETGAPIPDDITHLVAREDGTFSLAPLGWCFINSATYP